MALTEEQEKRRKLLREFKDRHNMTAQQLTDAIPGKGFGKRAVEDWMLGRNPVNSTALWALYFVHEGIDLDKAETCIQQ